MFTATTAVDADGNYEGKVSWPAYFYGPKGASQVFNNEDEVPEGWVDHPSKLSSGKSRQQPAPPVESPYKDKTDAEVIEALKVRKLDFNEKWPRPKLEQVLLDDDAKAAK